MVHTFRINDTNIAVDVNSGAVHEVGGVAFDLLCAHGEKFAGQCPQSLINALDKYRAEDVAEAYGELAELCEAGLLFSEDAYAARGTQRNPVIKALCLHVSHDCNLRCGYCFAGTGDFHGERCVMTEETGRKAIDFVIQRSGGRRNIEIDFFGGEPLMNFEVVKKLTAYAREREKTHGKNFRLTLTTNGVLLDADKLAFINEHMSNLVLSIDGRKRVNDHMRKTVNGGGSYELILPRLKAAAQSRKQDNYYARGTFTRCNLDFCADVLHLADEGFRQISVEPVVGGAETDYAIREEDLPEIFAQYEQLAEAYLERSGTDGWFNFFHFMIDLDQGPCVIKRMSGCGAGCEYVAVTPDGEIYPCHQFVGNREFLMGSVHDGSYHEEKARAFAAANVYTKRQCGDCWAKFYCSGGCHANAYRFGGAISEPYAVGCAMEKKRIECALYIKAKQLAAGV
ncbi:MAG: thioether cross-link-forming SCIFF peptide maturase [Clostridiales bacterium]|jgi:uncharacterized protein|nr:thioether cross-link-forming SCIFF peptide maturase [Clostridiales bacterium]